MIINSIKTQHDRGNGLGGGFAAYGIYPDFKDHYAVHVMCETKDALNEFESFLKDATVIDQQERIPDPHGHTDHERPAADEVFREAQHGNRQSPFRQGDERR